MLVVPLIIPASPELSLKCKLNLPLPMWSCSIWGIILLVFQDRMGSPKNKHCRSLLQLHPSEQRPRPLCNTTLQGTFTSANLTNRHSTRISRQTKCAQSDPDEEHKTVVFEFHINGSRPIGINLGWTPHFLYRFH